MLQYCFCCTRLLVRSNVVQCEKCQSAEGILLGLLLIHCPSLLVRHHTKGAEESWVVNSTSIVGVIASVALSAPSTTSCCCCTSFHCRAGGSLFSFFLGRLVLLQFFEFEMHGSFSKVFLFRMHRSS